MPRGDPRELEAAGYTYGDETSQEELRARQREEQQTVESQLETWDPSGASDEEYANMQSAARRSLASRMYAAGADADEVREELKKFDDEWSTRRAEILQRRVREYEDRLIEEQRGISEGRIEGQGTQLAKKLVTEAVGRQQSFGRTMGGRATTFARLAGRASDEVSFKGAQAVREIRSQEMERARESLLQMEYQRNRQENVELQEQQKINMQEALASAEEESAMWATIFGVGGGLIGATAGFFGGGFNPATAAAGASAGFSIGAKIGENV